MASKSRVTLRRKHKIQKEENNNKDNDDDAFEPRRSPVRQVCVAEAGQSMTNVPSPRFRSPAVTPNSIRSRVGKTTTEDTSLDESSDKLSQVPTPSKWSCLLPDYNSSQADDACEVLWDCASPDAIKHLRRRRKGDKSIKEIVKHFDDGGPSKTGARKSPPLQLQLFRASLLQQQQQQHPQKNASRKQKKLVQKRKQLRQTSEQARQLFGQILSAVERRQELEAQQEAEQSDTAAGAPDEETANTGNTDNDEDCWDDNELFEDNSFIINATQNPYEFLDAADASVNTPKRKAENAARFTKTADAMQAEECSVLSSSSVLDSQNSGVIPPTLAPAGAKMTVNANSKDKKPTVTAGPGVGKASGSSCVASSSAGPFSPWSRFQRRRQNTAAITPKRLAQSFNTAAGSVQKVDETAINSRNPTALQTSAQHSASSQKSNSNAHAQQNPQGKPPVSVTHTTNSGAFPRSSAGKNTAVSSGPNKTSCVQSIHSCRQTSHAGAQNGASSNRAGMFLHDNKKTRALSAKASQEKRPPSLKFSDDMSDDGLSDELLLKLTEQDDVFDSQIIQEFPTQAPVKLSAPAKLTPAKPVSTKPVSANFDDFADDLDPEILATICEYDSFSESPKFRGKVNNQPAKTIPSKSSREQLNNGLSGQKQPRLQESAPQKPIATSASSIAVNSGKRNGFTFYPSASVKPNTRSGSGDQNYRSSTVTRGTASSSSSHQTHKLETVKNSAYPSFGQNQQEKMIPFPPSVSSTVVQKPSQTGKRKFVFKPVTSSNSASFVSQASVSAASNPPTSMNNASKACNSAMGGLSSQTVGDDDDELMADDALYESQIIALLDKVESTQQPLSQTSPQKCSQDEIEKKRQAAMQRKLRSKTRTS